LLLLVALLVTGCATHHGARPLAPNPVADRAAYIERRAADLIRRGAPRDRALGMAAGDWFNESVAADRRLEAMQRAEGARLDAALAAAQRR
jgi:hypothetical protein